MLASLGFPQPRTPSLSASTLPRGRLVLAIAWSKASPAGVVMSHAAARVSGAGRSCALQPLGGIAQPCCRLLLGCLHGTLFSKVSGLGANQGPAPPAMTMSSFASVSLLGPE